ncbi:CD166 antigen homolog isoform X7 [Thunnus maccoyii]|uniref:CD166 antigen homolog isoform X7 n=1 Tax=Thunnus maccoyii TaxID=8240 RepID=UPI001C4A9931|nr:CD166 antigen homolog isoform X7 [Thunnus maccoyii]
MAGGRLRRFSCFLAYSALLLLGVSLHDVEASSCDRTIHKKVGDTVELPSCLPTEGVNSAFWKYNNTKVADKDAVVTHPQFKGRVDLNPTDFSLTVRRLTLQDSGVFILISEVNDKQRPTVFITLQVHKPIMKQPILTVNSTWHASNESCTVVLECSAPSDRKVSYNWTMMNQTSSGSRLQYNIQPIDGNINFTCTIFNSVSEKSASETVKCSNNTSTEKLDADIILVSPVHPVTEGDSVTLGCKLKTGELLSNVFFYQNVKLIQNDTRGELKISAVSKSDEGFYKCKYSGKESVQSWMSVKVSRPESSSSLIPLIVGLVCGIIIIILLLLLYCYRRFKDSHFIRPIQHESTNQNENSSSLHDAGESQDITYSSIELKNIAKAGKRHETVESSVYADVKIGSAADDNLTYTQVNYHNKGKAKKHKGKSTPAATDEAVYSEVKPGTSLGQ